MGLLHQKVAAQDSLKVKSEITSTPDSLKEKAHSPSFAALASAIIPGAGQVYNRKYWKVPIIYAALGTAAYFTYYNANVYYTVHNNINSRIAEDTIFGQPQFLELNQIFSKQRIDLNQYSTADLQSIQDDYRKNFTLSLIVGSVIYILNIVDAVVDAHLFHFDVSDDLSMNVSPEIFYANSFKPTPGVSLSLSLK